MQIFTVGLDIANMSSRYTRATRLVARSLRYGYDGDKCSIIFETYRPALSGWKRVRSYHWARQLRSLGHDVRLMPPGYVKPYVKRNKTDAADAEAIAEAVTRPTMRFVSVKSIDQQAALMLHRVRELLVRQRTMLAAGLRAHLAEFGIVAPQGIHRVEKLSAEVRSGAVPPLCERH